MSVVIGKIRSHAMDVFRIVKLRMRLKEKLLYKSIPRMHVSSEVICDKKIKHLSFGEGIYFSKNVMIRVMQEGHLSFGDRCFFNCNVCITAWGKTVIGNDVLVGPNVVIFDHNHDYKAVGGVASQHMKFGEIQIGNNVWIGAGAVILAGADIGDGAVIAAGSIVNGKIPPKTVYIQKREATLIKY